MEENLRSWLWPHRGDAAQNVAPQGPNVLRKQLRLAHLASRVSQIKHGPRHTYCSYLLARDGNVDALLLNVGHEDADTTFRHYASKIATKKAASAFWAIYPNQSENASVNRQVYIVPTQAAA